MISIFFFIYYFFSFVVGYQYIAFAKFDSIGGDCLDDPVEIYWLEDGECVIETGGSWLVDSIQYSESEDRIYYYYDDYCEDENGNFPISSYDGDCIDLSLTYLDVAVIAVCRSGCGEGTCDEQDCNCAGTGCTGDYCQDCTPVCDPECQNGGFCAETDWSPGSCDCEGTGYKGTDCTDPDDSDYNLEDIGTLVQVNTVYTVFVAFVFCFFFFMN